LHDGKPVQVEVRTGLDDDTFTEIVSGDLREGDAVIISERAGGAKPSAAAGPAMRLP
jgi:HlyD family secretion protein